MRYDTIRLKRLRPAGRSSRRCGHEMEIGVTVDDELEWKWDGNEDESESEVASGIRNGITIGKVAFSSCTSNIGIYASERASDSG